MNLKAGANGYDARPYLAVRGLGDLAAGQTVKLSLGASIVLGRSRHCDWSLRRTPRYLMSANGGRAEITSALAYSSVSRRHTRLSYLAPDMVEIENLSGNGTLVDGKSVDKVVLTDCRQAVHRIQLGPKGVVLELQPGSLPLG